MFLHVYKSYMYTRYLRPHLQLDRAPYVVQCLETRTRRYWYLITCTTASPTVDSGRIKSIIQLMSMPLNSTSPLVPGLHLLGSKQYTRQGETVTCIIFYF